MRIVTRSSQICNLMIDIYVCLLLHVLIGDEDQIVVNDNDSKSMSSWVEEKIPNSSLFGKFKSLFKGGNETDNKLKDAETAAGIEQPQQLDFMPIAQHYYPDRSLIYNQVKSMRETNLIVAVEQLSIFLTSDGTVITFFQVVSRHSSLIVEIGWS